jgi:hypothetical protein
MKNVIKALLITAFISSSILAQSYGLGNTDPSVFSKYRIPETNLHSFWINPNFSFSSTKNISSNTTASYLPYYPTEVTNTTSTYNSSLTASVYPRYYLLNENDERVFSLDIYMGGLLNYNTSRQSGDLHDNDNKEFNFNSEIKSNYLRYFNSSELFLSASAALNVSILTKYIDNTVYPFYTGYTGEKKQSYLVSFGFGLGKVRNVTSLVSAIRLQERLKQLNLLNNDLNESTIENLAQQFARLNYYSEVYDRSEKYFWQGIDNVLSQEKVSLKGLNMYSSAYLREVNNEVRFLRREGLAASVNLQFNYNNNYSSTYFIPSKVYEQLYIMGNASVDFSSQLNLNSQIHSSLFLSGGPGLIENSDLRQQYLINLGIGYNYEFTDKIVISVDNNFYLNFYNYKSHTSQQRNLTDNLNFTLAYFIEDNIAINIHYTWSFNELKDYMAKQSLCDNNIQVGLTYFFDRGFIIN